jgi:hypothetical protein
MKTSSPKGSKLSSQKTHLVFLPILLGLLMTSSQLGANTPALSFTTNSNSFVYDGSSAGTTAGWSFSLTTPTFVTAFGVWDENSDGLAQSHPITLWLTLTMETVAQTTVDNSGTLVDGFRYASLTSPLLLPADNYTIGAFYSSRADNFVGQAATVTTAAGVTYIRGGLVFSNQFPFDDVLGTGGANGYFGANFQIGTPIPEPASTLLLVPGSIIILFARRRALPRRLSTQNRGR